ncbi:hypothetical protein [Paenibacillus donghaensis]|uniref:Uncharacterized protein n=1 Tax=Paenibacillus donghaensis TaxID=414771 RepID=A0A2Z2KFL9_9BACL|nr:hypothetical protein [Paenibacillus donghaensis]ASA21910.1 hypothetical protein B9T62_14665 [Paenibacillus donghaensis]
MPEVQKIHYNKALILLVILLLTDLLLYVLRMQEIYPVPYVAPPMFYIVAFNLFVVIGIMLLLRKRAAVFYSIPVLLIVLAGSYLVFSFIGNQYVFLPSPERSESIVVKYHRFVMIDTSYVFEFYQKDCSGLWMSKLVGQQYTYTLPIHDNPLTPEEVLGLQKGRWTSEKELVFDTVTDKLTIKLK